MLLSYARSLVSTGIRTTAQGGSYHHYRLEELEIVSLLLGTGLNKAGAGTYEDNIQTLSQFTNLTTERSSSRRDQIIGLVECPNRTKYTSDAWWDKDVSSQPQPCPSQKEPRMRRRVTTT